MLNSSRGSNGFNINCISYQEILAYYELMQVRPDPWEIEIIRYFDNIVMDVYSEKAKAEQKSKK